MIKKLPIHFILFLAIAIAQQSPNSQQTLNQVNQISVEANAQWGQTNGAYKKYINCLAVFGTNRFGGTYDCILLSPANGATWAIVDSGFMNTRVYSL